jgi:hypothetical protein
MADGTVAGMCSETAELVYANGLPTSAAIEITVRNTGDCEVGLYDQDRYDQSLPGTIPWPPGQSFLQTAVVPGGSQVWLRCGLASSSSQSPGPGLCRFVWNVEASPNLGERLPIRLAIDPLALILQGSVYLILKLPDPPPEAQVRQRARQLLESMSSTDRAHAATTLKDVQTYLDLLEDEVKRS